MKSYTLAQIVELHSLSLGVLASDSLIFLEVDAVDMVINQFDRGTLAGALLLPDPRLFLVSQSLHRHLI
ncbi:MAG: hypothetical protein AAF572_05635 [Cyanobacteria bacterium P01_B01_bin.77]